MATMMRAICYRRFLHALDLPHESFRWIEDRFLKIIEVNSRPNMTLAVLDTTRLLLRQLKETDVSAIYSLRSNEQVNQFIDRPTAKNPEEAKAFIQKISDGIAENKSYYWGITLKENGTM